ncbi:MAG: hypothetical protein P8Y13_01800 [Deinococcales bacterium]
MDLTVRAELHVAVEAVEGDVGDRVPDGLGVEGAGILERLDERLDVGDARRRVVVGLVAEALLIGVRELLGIAEVVVPKVGRRQPRRHPEGVVGVATEGLPEVGGRHAHGERVHLGAEVEALGLSDEVEHLGLVARDQNRVGVLALELRDDGAEIRRVGAVAFVQHDVHAGVVGKVGGALGHAGVERVVGVEQPDGLGGRVELAHHVDGALEVGASRRKGAEDVLVTAAEDLPGGAAALDHGHLVLLGHGRGDEHEAARVGPEQEVDLVLRQELGVLPHGQVVVGLVVEHLEGELVGLAAHRHAALLVDGVDRHLEGILVVATGVGEAAGELQRRAERDGLCRRRDAQADETEHQGSDDELDGSHPTFPLSTGHRSRLESVNSCHHIASGPEAGRTLASTRTGVRRRRPGGDPPGIG